MTSLSATKPYFFSSLRINLSAARLFLLVWTSTSSTSPSAPREPPLGSDLVAFLGAGLAGFAAGFAFGDLREFFTFFLAVPANHRDHLGEMASMLRVDRRQRLQGAASGYERNDRVGATGHGRVLHRIHAKAVP